MMVYIVKDELSHYGVRGMKWGIRKQQNSTRGRRSQANPQQIEVRRANIKKAAKIGVAVAVVAAAAYGGYKIHNIRQSNKAAVGKYILENGYFGKQKIKGKQLHVQGFLNPNAKGYHNELVKTYITRKDTLSKGILGPNVKVSEVTKSFTKRPVYLGADAYGNNISGHKVASSSMLRDYGRNDPVRNKVLTKEQTKYYADYYNRYIRGK